MRNVWKGLIVGGLTGAGAGAVLDLLARGSQGALLLGGRAKSFAPVAGDRIRSAAESGAHRVEQADLTDRLRGAAHRMASTDAAGHAKEAVETGLDRGKDMVDALRQGDLPFGPNRS